MSNAATLAGLAFSNAFVGVNHALAHAVGARFGIAHGRANAIFLPHVLRYNAALAAQVHAGAGLHDLRRAGQVRADGVGARSRRTECRRAPRAPVRPRRGPARRRSGMPNSLGELGICTDEFEAALARPRGRRVRGSQPPHQPADAAALRAHRAARGRLDRRCGDLRSRTGEGDGWRGRRSRHTVAAHDCRPHDRRRRAARRSHRSCPPAASRR